MKAKVSNNCCKSKNIGNFYLVLKTLQPKFTAIFPIFKNKNLYKILLIETNPLHTDSQLSRQNPQKKFRQIFPLFHPKKINPKYMQIACNPVNCSAQNEPFLARPLWLCFSVSFSLLFSLCSSDFVAPHSHTPKGNF